jgi:hypothetical protein
VKYGGTFLIQDVATSYWLGMYKGGLNRRGTTDSFFKSLLESLNSTYLRKVSRKFDFDVKTIESIQFHNLVIVVRKTKF